MGHRRSSSPLSRPLSKRVGAPVSSGVDVRAALPRVPAPPESFGLKTMRKAPMQLPKTGLPMRPPKTEKPFPKTGLPMRPPKTEKAFPKTGFLLVQFLHWRSALACVTPQPPPQAQQTIGFQGLPPEVSRYGSLSEYYI